MAAIHIEPALEIEASPLVCDPAVIATVVHSVHRRFDGRWSRRDVEVVVLEELSRFRQARVTNFIPILVERMAVDRLLAASREPVVVA